MSDAAASPSVSPGDKSATSRGLIVFAVMAATIMQVIDITIVNVALPKMQGALSATTDQITWVLTSYLVASAIFMPLTGFITDRIGQKRYLLLSIGGFVASSALCGMATSLTEMVVFRLLQGVFGASLSPLSQSIMVQTFPPAKRGQAMAIWGIGVTAGPILGPTLGGWLTQVLSWRWDFYVNLPVGILAFLLTLLAVPETARKDRRMDWFGLAFMALAIAALQVVLDRGNTDDWFASNTIRVLSFLSFAGLLCFLVHGIGRKGKDNIFDLSLFRDRNFASACLLITAMGLGMYGTLVLQPEFLETLLNYPVLTTGLVMAPRGFASMFGMFLVGRLIHRVDARLLVLVGIVLSLLGSFAMADYSLNINFFWVIWPILLQGIGLGMIFVPLATIAYSTLPVHKSAEAAGMFNLLRTVGSSIGISIVTTLFTQESQINWNVLGGHMTASNPAFQRYLADIGLPKLNLLGAQLMGGLLGQQAAMIAFVDCFVFIGWTFVFMIPLLLFVKAPHRHDRVDPMAAIAE
jgi:DHA2 family multidrug resistance protein